MDTFANTDGHMRRVYLDIFDLQRSSLAQPAASLGASAWFPHWVVEHIPLNGLFDTAVETLWPCGSSARDEYALHKQMVRDAKVRKNSAEVLGRWAQSMVRSLMVW
ncbi:hypothetical protein V8F44DRAFT_535957 [Aspergillus fumigatus]|jgi:hypothetical protein